MRFDGAQLEALAAVVEEGTFDAAARRLHVTPSAVSQRVKALEQHLGQVLVRRSRPCRATEAGNVLVRLAGQLRLLEDESLREVRRAGAPGPDAGDGPGAVRMAVAVNADSLSTWLPDALGGLPEGVHLDLRREDQDHSAELLRDGTVMAAVTADARAVQGCRVRPLGSMRYLAVASPAYAARWFADGLGVLDRAPLLTFNRKDALQQQFLRALGHGAAQPPVHYVPSSTAFVDLVGHGLGWGMVPDVTANALLAEGTLVELDPGRHLDVPLYWQHWKLRAPALDDLTRRVVVAAGSALHRDV
ncbi:MAG TPA: LysR family transcriptional regulator ArgP [Cellulomonadaceae bacterium]|nr:LysR family transcriptional regulator ArgP [Cellulomonadaceae bacterium]